MATKLPAKKIKKKARKKVIAPQPQVVAEPPAPAPWVRIPNDALYRSKLVRTGVVQNAFDYRTLTRPPPGVLPKRRASDIIAMDEATFEASSWAAQQMFGGAYFNGVAFLGYTYLSELAQRPEYRKISEVRAEECTREWISLKSISRDQGKTERIKELGEFLESIQLRWQTKRLAELDGFFGRGHLYLDTGSTDDKAELKTPIGNGRDAATKAKFRGQTGFLKAVRCVEPVWCYPAFYNAIDPLKADWYNPNTWYVMGKEINKSRLIRVVGAEVPDLLKPSYAFGGLSLTQMSKPYVDNWLRTRQSVADLIWTFSVSVLKTDLTNALADGAAELFKRLELFANLRTNQGVFAVDKTEEDFANVSAPLGTLDHLQAQAQEQMCSVSSTPVVKLLGIQPSGLNATADGELTVWYDHVGAYQERVLSDPVRTVIDLAQMSLWGERDPDIDFEWNPLKVMSAKERADLEKAEGDRDVAFVGSGILDPTEVRKRLSDDVDGPYHGINPDAAPEQPGMEGMEDEDLGDGLDPENRPPDERRDGSGDGRTGGERKDRPMSTGAAAGQARTAAGEPRQRSNGQHREGWDRGGGKE